MLKKLNMLYLSIGTKIRMCLHQNPFALRVLLKFGPYLFILLLSAVITVTVILISIFRTP